MIMKQSMFVDSSEENRVLVDSVDLILEKLKTEFQRQCELNPAYFVPWCHDGDEDQYIFDGVFNLRQLAEAIEQLEMNTGETNDSSEH